MDLDRHATRERHFDLCGGFKQYKQVVKGRSHATLSTNCDRLPTCFV